jgi:hypothetical protein
MTAAKNMNCHQSNPELECALFLRGLSPRFSTIVQSFKYDAMTGKHAYPTEILDTIPILDDSDRHLKLSTASSALSQTIFSIQQDDVEREALSTTVKKSEVICFDFNSAEGCSRGSDCRFAHKKAPEKTLKKQSGWVNRSASVNSKEKCDVCNGDHPTKKCAIVILGNKALREENGTSRSINSINERSGFIDDVETVTRWRQGDNIF